MTCSTWNILLFLRVLIVRVCGMLRVWVACVCVLARVGCVASGLLCVSWGSSCVCVRCVCVLGFVRLDCVCFWLDVYTEQTPFLCGVRFFWGAGRGGGGGAYRSLQGAPGADAPRPPKKRAPHRNTHTQRTHTQEEPQDTHPNFINSKIDSHLTSTCFRSKERT